MLHASWSARSLADSSGCSLIPRTPTLPSTGNSWPCQAKVNRNKCYLEIFGVLRYICKRPCAPDIYLVASTGPFLCGVAAVEAYTVRGGAQRVGVG